MQELSRSEVAYWDRQSRIYKRAYVSFVIIAINVAIFLLGGTIMPWIYEKGVMVTALVVENGEYYRLLSATFLHADVNHLMNNMLMLLLAGAVVENYTGHGFYLLLYILAGLMGNIISMAHELQFNLLYASVGASGAIMGTMGFIVAWIIINWKSFAKSRNVVFRLMVLGIFILHAVSFQKGANTTAHFGGLLTGLIMGFINIVIFKNRKKMEGLA